MPYRSVFDVVWSGRRNMIMMASQIDRTGNQNISAIGAVRPAQGAARRRARRAGQLGQPPDQLLGARPLDPHASSSRSTSCAGVGYARAAAAGAVGHPLPRDPLRRLQPRGLRLRDRPTTPCACASVHPGVTVDEVVAATGFALAVPDDVPETRCPTPEELDLIRTVLDPPRPARPRGPRRDPPAPHPALHTAFCELVGVRVPDRADRHGLGGRPPAGGRHRRGRRAWASWPRPP